MSTMNGQSKANGMHAGEASQTPPFGLIDAESGNMVGSFASEREALLAVAATARQYGTTSEAVLSLSLFRDDVPAERGFIADGTELVQRALAAADVVEHAPPRMRSADHPAPRRARR